MRRVWIGALILLTLATGCSRGDDGLTASANTEQVVQVRTIEKQMKYETLDETGIVSAKDIVPYSLKLGGILKDVYVEIGDSVFAGQLLAEADNSDAEIGVQSASEMVAAAQLDYEKAVAARDYYQNLYDQTETLYNSGAVSKKDLDDLGLQLELSQKDVDQANKVLNQARLDSVYKNSQADDFSIVSGLDGTVVDVLHKSGEIVGAGYPVVIVSGNEQMVSIYLTQEEMERLEASDAPVIQMTIGDETVEGTLDAISHIPDEMTRTYRVDIAISGDKNYLLGALCDVSFQIHAIDGFWVPIAYIKNDNGAFVYVVNNEGRIEVKSVTLHEISGESVRVEGLAEGDQIVASKGLLIQGQHVQTAEGEE
jgi:RND family efflux transporter MFP subunit